MAPGYNTTFTTASQVSILVIDMLPFPCEFSIGLVPQGPIIREVTIAGWKTGNNNIS